MNDQIEAFLLTLQAERGAADNTLQAYRRDLVDFSAWLGANAMVAADADRAAIERYIAEMATHGLSAATRRAGCRR